MKGILLLAFVACVLCSFDYQERVIFYNNNDYICKSGVNQDNLYFDIKLDGQPYKKFVLMAGMGCGDSIPPIDRMFTPSWWHYQFKDQDRIKINQEVIAYKFLGKLIMMKVKSTIKEPSKIQKNIVLCRIVGNGKQQHYGVGIKGQQDCVYRISCESLRATE